MIRVNFCGWLNNLILINFFFDILGWLQTFEQYFTGFTKGILDSAVDRLPHLPDMTFIWTEISFLALWFETATLEQKNIFRDLVQSGRIEITTGEGIFV